MQIESFDKQITELKNANECFKEIIEEKNPEIDEVKKREELKNSKKSSEDVLSTKLSEIQTLNENIKEKQQIINELTKRNEILNSQLEDKEIDEELLIQMDELIKANEELEKFAENAANELQEPLRAIKSFNNILSKRCEVNLIKMRMNL